MSYESIPEFSIERLKTAADILEDYIEYLKKHEPYAISSIAILEEALEELC